MNVVSLKEKRIEKDYVAFSKCSNFSMPLHSDFINRKPTKNIRKAMTKGYISMLTNFNK